MLRIGFDASAAARNGGTGVSHYVGNLLRTLGRIDRANRYVVCLRLSRRRYRKQLQELAGGHFRIKTIQEPFNLILPHRLDVFHGPDARLPRYKAPGLVATVHDLFSLVSDQYADDKFRAKKIRRYESLAEKATRIIAVSENTKRDLVERLGVTPSQVEVIPEGVSENFHPRPLEEVACYLESRSVPENYVLFVGSISVRKNVPRMVQAMASLRKRLPNPPYLVIAGRNSFGHEEVLKTIEEVGGESWVVQLGYVSSHELPFLYSGARMLLFPTLHEGFGLPILEAMACQIPVLTSNQSANPEVAGDAAVLVNPESVEEIENGAEILLTDEEIRTRFVILGSERAKQFTWESTAIRTVRVYESAAAARR